MSEEWTEDDGGASAQTPEDVNTLVGPLGDETDLAGPSFDTGGADNPMDQVQDEGAMMTEEEKEKKEEEDQWVAEYAKLTKKEFEKKIGEQQAGKWLYIPPEIRWGDPLRKEDICYPIPSQALPLAAFLRDDGAQLQVQHVSYGDQMSLLELLNLIWGVFECAILYEYQSAKSVLPWRTRALVRLLDPGQDIEGIKKGEREFKGKNLRGQLNVMDVPLKLMEAKLIDFGKLQQTKFGRDTHPVLQEIEGEVGGVTKLKKLHAAFQKDDAWKRWAQTKDHTILEPKQALPATNKATEKEMAEKTLLLRKAAELMSFFHHAQDLHIRDIATEKERKELEAQIALARATATRQALSSGTFLSPPSFASPTHAAPPASTTGSAPTTVIVNNNDKKDRQAIMQAFQKYTKSDPTALTLYAETASQKDTDAGLRDKLRRIDACMKQHPTDETQEYEALSTLLDPSILTQGFDVAAYKTLRAGVVSARKTTTDLQCTVPVAVLLQYFKTHGYQHLCTGTLIGFEIFQEVNTGLGDSTRLAAILTEVSAKYGLFYSRKSIILYFLSALCARHPSKLARLIQSCPSFKAVKKGDFLETNIYEKTVAATQPDDLFKEVLDACSELDTATESLSSTTTQGVVGAQAAHATRVAGLKRGRDEKVPCYRYFSYMTCKKEQELGLGNCPYSHDSDDVRMRNTFLRELKGSRRGTYFMYKKELEERKWSANMVDDAEFRGAIISFLEKMQKKEAKEQQQGRPMAPTRGGGMRGSSRGSRGTQRGGGRGGRGHTGYRPSGGWTPTRTPTRPPRGSGYWNSSSSSSSSNYPQQAYAAASGDQQDAGTDPEYDQSRTS